MITDFYIVICTAAGHILEVTLEKILPHIAGDDILKYHHKLEHH